MPRDVTATNKAKLAQVEATGYRVGIGEYNGLWMVTAKRDNDGQFHFAKGSGEEEVIEALLALMGIAVDDCEPPQ